MKVRGAEKTVQVHDLPTLWAPANALHLATGAARRNVTGDSRPHVLGAIFPPALGFQHSEGPCTDLRWFGTQHLSADE